MQDSPVPKALNDSRRERVVGCPSPILTEDGLHELLGDAFKAVTEVNVDGYRANHGRL